VSLASAGLSAEFQRMKAKSAKAKPAPKIDWDKVAEENRQRCNTLTDEERRRYRDLALRIYYSADAETHASRG
jgi:hypothetical protein